MEAFRQTLSGSRNDGTQPTQTPNDSMPANSNQTGLGQFDATSSGIPSRQDDTLLERKTDREPSTLQPDLYQSNDPIANESTSANTDMPSSSSGQSSSLDPLTHHDTNGNPSLSSENLPDAASLPPSRARSFSPAEQAATPPNTDSVPIAGPIGNSVSGKPTSDLTDDAENAGFVGNTDFGAGSSNLKCAHTASSGVAGNATSGDTLAFGSSAISQRIPTTAGETDVPASTTQPTTSNDAATTEVQKKLSMPGGFETPQPSFAGDVPTVSSFGGNNTEPVVSTSEQSREPTVHSETSEPTAASSDAAASTSLTASNTALSPERSTRTEPNASNVESGSDENSTISSSNYTPKNSKLTVTNITRNPPEDATTGSTHHATNPDSRPTAQALESFNREVDTAFRSPPDVQAASGSNTGDKGIDVSHLGERLPEPTSPTRPTGLGKRESGSRFMEMTETGTQEPQKVGREDLPETPGYAAAGGEAVGTPASEKAGYADSNAATPSGTRDSATSSSMKPNPASQTEEANAPSQQAGKREEQPKKPTLGEKMKHMLHMG